MFTWMTMLLLAMAGQTAPAPDHSVAERDGVRIECSLRAQVYTWKITNLRPEPITRFEIEQHHAYSQGVPPGWEFEHKDHLFVAWAKDARDGIQTGKTGIFTARGSSDGALLGLRPAVVGVYDNDRAVTFDALWTPISKPLSWVWLVIGGICVMAILHVLLIRRKPLRT